MLNLYLLLPVPFLLNAFAQESYRPVRLGRPLPIQTLTPPARDAVSFEHLSLGNDVSKDNNAPTVFEDDYHRSSQDPVDDYEDDETLEHLSKYVPYDSTNNMTLVRTGLQKRAPKFRGTMQMNCKKAREACQNACWYQNCVRGAQGNPAHVTYTEGASNVAAGNRIQAGTTTSPRGTPCNAWPFGQRFWDTYPLQKGVEADGVTQKTRAGMRLQTDEWPMASWYNEPFDSSKQPPQRSLRCITNTDNSKGSTEWRTFRHGIGAYGAGGAKAHLRPESGILRNGDTFNVDFDMSEFDQNNKDDQEVMKDVLYYCIAPFNNCENDGMQSYMSDLVRRAGAGAGAGNLDWPYDAPRMNEYTVFGESNSIKAYHAIVSIRNGEEFDVTVSVLDNGSVNELVSDSQTLQDEDFMTVQGNLPQPLKITRRDPCGLAEIDTPSLSNLVEFEYATPEDPAYFAFNSADFVLRDFAARDRVTGRNAGRYCLPTDIISDDGADTIGVKFDCWFPGW